MTCQDYTSLSYHAFEHMISNLDEQMKYYQDYWETIEEAHVGKDKKASW